MYLIEKLYKAHCVGETPKGAKQSKKELYKYLDGFTFADQYEIQGAVLDFCGITAPSYAELIFWEAVADYYIKENKPDIDWVLPF